MQTLINLLLPVSFLLVLLLERLAPARPLPPTRFWTLKCVAFFVVAATLSAPFPALLASVVGPHAPLHLGRLGLWPGALAGLLLGDLASYLLHRLLHNVPWLWRFTHQLHHSAERVDAAGVASADPFDVILMSLVTTAVAVLLGVSADAAALAGFLSFAIGLFQHMNVRTPQWIGWIIQRPEAHSVHHARGIHAYNYGNFMIWDILFGTFRNPADFVESAGFWDGASRRVGAMLIGRDVSEPT